MEHFGVAIIGLGPAGSALTRKSTGKIQVVTLDKKHQHDTEGFSKPCGGLLALDAQRPFTRGGLTLPVNVAASPQIFNVKTVDITASLTRNYQRSYININHHAFDLWVESLIPAGVEVCHDGLCRKIWREDDRWHVIFCADNWEQCITARYPIDADDASSMVWRHLYPDHQIYKYVAIQQWFVEKHPVSFYFCILDSAVTDCHSWSISEDGYFIFGGAYPMKDGQARFTTLKGKMSVFQFQFGKAVKNEKCTVPFPSHWQDFVCGGDNTFLIGEAAGSISASSLKGISYAPDNTEILRSVLLKLPEKLDTACWRAIRKLRLKPFSKIVKSRYLTAPALRKWATYNGVAHIPQSEDYPTRFMSSTSRM